jgi:DNA repair protein RadC
MIPHPQREPAPVPPVVRPAGPAEDPRRLDDGALLALAAGSAPGAPRSVAAARRLLARMGGLRRLAQATPADLHRAGLSGPRARRVAAAFELGRRAAAEALAQVPPLESPQLAAAAVRELIGTRRREVFLCLFLDARHRPLGHEELFTGTVDGAVVHVREVAAAALALGAVNVVVAHNHPSGDPEPSAADAAITRRLQQALALLDIGLLDHLVVGAGRVVSLAERGLLVRDRPRGGGAGGPGGSPGAG